MSKDKTGDQAVAERKPDRKQLAEVGSSIDEIRRKHETGLAEARNDFDRAYVLACSLIDLRQAVKNYMPVLKMLQGSKLGFLTDRDPGKDYKNQGPYPEAVVVDCAIEAIMRGANWTGNEFNILAGGCFLTKEYWWRKVNQIPGLTDLDLSPGVPFIDNQKTVVDFQATWKINGKVHQLDRRLSIIVRGGQTDDATLGKAEARMLKAIYRKVTGTQITDADDDEPRVQMRPPVGRPAPAITAPTEPDESEPTDDHPGRLFDAPVDVGAIK
jgi:hypothetical protein